MPPPPGVAQADPTAQRQRRLPPSTPVQKTNAMTQDRDGWPHPTIPKLKPHQIWDESEGCPIGHDPRGMTPAELEALGFTRRPPLKAIRARCIDCAAGDASEVRRCGQFACPSWLYRMGTDPWHRRRLTDDQRADQARRLSAAVKRTPKSGTSDDGG